VVDWAKYKPNLRDGVDFATGIIVGKFVLPYVSRGMKSMIRSAYEETFAQERVEREKLYEKMSSLNERIDELTNKKAETSA